MNLRNLLYSPCIMSIKTIFLDRDGVINRDVGYLYKIKEFEFMTGIFQACLHFQKLGYKIIIVSNQSGIARGYYRETDYQVLTRWMKAKFENKNIEILDALHCPHGPDSSCHCRKPKPGMFLESKSKFNIDMGLSWIIGDKESDITSAKAAGINNSILIQSGSEVDKKNSKALHIIDSIKDSISIIT
jgi:D-glycero-D-manno-heptose 1,7-bisphosphate phosphatase